MASAAIDLGPGQSIAGLRGRYTVDRALGSGGFGHAFVARADDGREVVLKQLRVDRMGDWKALELFGREARHPVSVSVAVTGMLLIALIIFFVAIFPAL